MLPRLYDSRRAGMRLRLKSPGASFLPPPFLDLFPTYGCDLLAHSFFPLFELAGRAGPYINNYPAPSPPRDIATADFMPPTCLSCFLKTRAGDIFPLISPCARCSAIFNIQTAFPSLFPSFSNRQHLDESLLFNLAVPSACCLISLPPKS